jgi:hypothetical protein
MNVLVPNKLLFRFEYALPYLTGIRVEGDLADWPEAARLQDFGGLDGEEAFAQVWMGWNEGGLYLAVRVEGRTRPFECRRSAFWKGDNVRLCTDMRNTRDIKRASRYCQQFYFLPAGGGKDGNAAVGGAAKIHRAVENAPLPPDDAVRVASVRRGDWYSLEAHVPADLLSGWEPQEHSRIGLFVMVEDVELGKQPLTVGDELNWHIDPSTWASAILTRDAGSR